MPDALANLLRRCCVRVSGARHGTGFFIAPGRVVTCAHVVGAQLATGDRGIKVTWQDDVDHDAAIVHILPGGDEDIALLAVAFASHPCVILGTEVMRDDKLLAAGFPDYGDGPQGDNVTAFYESRTELPTGAGRFFHKFKGAHVISGFSGGPLLNLRTGRVIGVVTETRSRTADIGGWAIPTELLLSELAGVEQAQEAYGKADLEWEEALARDARKRRQVDTTLTELTRGVSSLPFNYNNRIEHYLNEYLGSPGHPVAFGGREAAMDELNGWLDNPLAPPYLFLAAPAGRGKSALLARWSQRLLQHPDLGVAFIPVSIRYKTNLSSFVFAATAARLAQLHGEAIPTNPNISVEIWQEIVLQYLERDLEGGRRLLLVIDGADEAADWELSPVLFPARPPRCLRIVVSARFTSDHPNVQSWIEELGWDSAGLAVPMELKELTEEGVADILERLDFPTGLLSDKSEFVKTLHRLSEGDPLLIQLYTRDLLVQAKAGTPLRADYLKGLPSGLEGYFQNWWDEQRKLWGSADSAAEKGVRKLLDTLSCALGPLSQDDVEALEPELDSHEMEIVLSRLHRFVIDDGHGQGYAFSHSRLADFFRDKKRMSRRRRREIRARYLEWGAQTLKEIRDGSLAPEEVSAYLVQYYYTHLADSETDLPARLALVSNEWRKSWEAFEGTSAGFLNDVSRIWQDSHVFDAGQAGKGKLAAYLGEEVRCALCQTSINSLAGNVPPELIVNLVEQTIWTPPQGIANAMAIPDHGRAALGLIRLLPHVPPGQRQNVLQKAVLKANSVDPSDRDNKGFRALPAEMAAQGYHEEALELAQEMRYLNDYLISVAEVGRYLEEPRKSQVLGEALQSYFRVEEPERDPQQERWRPIALAGLTAHLPPDEREPWLWQALEMIQRSFYPASMLPGTVGYLPPHLLQDAATLARLRAEDEHRYEERVNIRAAIVPFLPEPLRGHFTVEVFAHGLAAFRSRVETGYPVSDAIIKSAQSAPAALLPELVEAALRIPLEYWRAVTLAGIAGRLPEDLAAQAWKSAEQMKGSYARVVAMRDLVNALAPARRGDASDIVLAAAWDTTDEYFWAETLAKLASHLPPASLQRAAALVERLSSILTAETAAPAVATGLWAHGGEEALNAVRVFTSPVARTHGLRALLPALTGDALRNRIAREALEAAAGITYELPRKRALDALLPVAPPQLMGDLLTEAERFDNQFIKFDFLLALIPLLPEAELDRVLLYARRLPGAGSRVQLMKEAALRSGVTVRASVAEEILSFEADEEQTQSFRATAAHLLATCGRVEEALSIAKSHGQDWWQKTIITAAGPHLTVPLFREAFELIRGMEYSSSQADTLRALATFLPAELIQEAVSLALEFESDGSDHSSLAFLAKRAGELGLFQEAFEIVLKLERGWDVSAAVRELIPHLSREQLAEAINKIWAGGDWSGDGFEELAAFLPPEVIENLFSSLQEREPDEENKNLRWLVALFPHVEPARRAEAATHLLPLIENIEAMWLRIPLLETLAPHLPEQQKEQLLREIMRQHLAGASQAKAEPFHGNVFGELAGYLPPYALDEALVAVQELIEAEVVGDEAIRAFAIRYADLGQQDKAFSLIEGQMVSLAARTATLLALKSYLPPPRYRELLEQAHQLAQNIGDQPELVAALSGLVEHLSPTARATVEAEMMDFARAVPDPARRAKTLGEIFPRLSEPLRSGAIKEALDAARQVKEDDGHRQFDLLRLLAEKMAEAGDHEGALSTAQAIKSEYVRGDTLEAIIPSLPESRLEAALEDMRSTPLEMEEWRVGPLVQFALRFPEPRRTSLLRETIESASRTSVRANFHHSFSKVAPHLTDELAEEIVNRVIKTWRPSTQLIIFEVLAERLPERTVLQALEAVQAVRSTEEREKGLAGLAPRLAELGHLDKVELFLGTMTRKNQIAKTLVAVASYVDDTWHERALQAIALHSNAYSQKELLSDLLPSLSDARLEELIEAALNLEYQRPAATVLAQVVPRVGPKRRAELIEVILTRVRVDLKDGFRFSDTTPKELISIAPYLTTEEQFIAAFEIAQLEPDVTVLAALVGALSRMPDTRYDIFYRVLKMLSGRRRSDLLLNLGVSGGLLLAVGGAQAVERSAESITEVGHWWP